MVIVCWIISRRKGGGARCSLRMIMEVGEMKRIYAFLLVFAMLCTTVTVAFAVVTPNNYVWYHETGAYASRDGKYVEKPNTKTTWSFCPMYAKPGKEGAWGGKPTSTTGYLYSRETADRVSNVAKENILESHSTYYPSSVAAVEQDYGGWQYSKASYAVKNRTYKTVICVSTGGGTNASGNWEVHMYTVP